MKKILRGVFIWLLVSIIAAGASAAQAETMYARCNLKVVKGSLISWVNWQATTTYIPAGTKLEVSHKGAQASIVNPATGEKYTLLIGASGKEYLEKFVTKKPQVSPSRATMAELGMNKQDVYVVMGPPAWIEPSGNTNAITYDQIMGSDLWIYRRRRFGKNIGVEFDPTSGKVIRTEGIWR